MIFRILTVCLCLGGLFVALYVSFLLGYKLGVTKSNADRDACLEGDRKSGHDSVKRVIALKGSTVTFNCSLDYPDGKELSYLASWRQIQVVSRKPRKVKYEPLIENVASTIAGLDNVTEEDDGWYQCRLNYFLNDTTVIKGKWSSTYLEVEYPARVGKDINLNQTLTTGQSGIITVDVQGNPPLTFVSWTKDNKRFDPDPEQSGVELMSDGTLFIHNATKQHEGRYQCTPYNRHGTQGPSEVIHVSVLDKVIKGM